MVEIKGFAERVERLCEFLIENMDHDESRVEVQKLKDDAADIATGGIKINTVLELDGRKLADALRKR